MPGWRGALGGAIVRLYQNGGCDESLRFDNIAEAQRKSEALGKTVSEMKEAYDNAQSALSDSDKKIAGYNASIIMCLVMEKKVFSHFAFS